MRTAGWALVLLLAPLWCLLPARAVATEGGGTCWRYTLTVKEYLSAEFKHDVIVTEYTKSFTSQDDCKKAGQRATRTEAHPNWAIERREYSAGPCEACGNKSSSGVPQVPGVPPPNQDPQGFKSRDRELETAYSDAISKALVDWLLGVLNPLGRGRLANLVRLYPGDGFFLSALKTAGGSASAFFVAKGYIELVRTVSEAGLQRAMDLIQVPEEDRTKFIVASGFAVLRTPAGIRQSNDAQLAQDAFVSAARMPTADGQEEWSAVLLGVAGLVAAERGNRDLAATLLTAAHLAAQTLPDEHQAQVESLLGRTAPRLGAPLNQSGVVGTPVVKQSAAAGVTLAGVYDCISTSMGACPTGGASTLPGVDRPQTEEVEPLTITQDGSEIQLGSSTRTACEPWTGPDRGGMTCTYGALRTVTRWTGTGVLSGNTASLTCRTTYEASASSMRCTGDNDIARSLAEKMSLDLPPTNTTMESAATLRVVDATTLVIEWSSAGGTSETTYRRR